MPTQRRKEKRVGEQASKWERERGRGSDSSFYVLFLPLGLPYVSWASQECCWFYLRSSLWSSELPWTFLGLPFFYFRGLFPFLSFSHCHLGLLFPTLTFLTAKLDAA